MRPPDNWSQVAIICPIKRWFGALTRALCDAGLSAQVQSERDIKGLRPAFAWVAALVAIAAEPRNEFEVVGVLREVFGIADHDLAEWRKAGGSFGLESRPAGASGVANALRSLDELVDFFIAAGKKGVAINRYKGLGEMNPEQLWATTMDPQIRTLLQVRAEDHTEADLMLTTLMGDLVEPRRKFIEDNALDVKNLDV